MLNSEEILHVVHATRKRDPHRPTDYYFGYGTFMETKGTASDKKLIRLIRYITREGDCAGCRTEFRFDDLTLHRIKPGHAGGTYELPNVQLMCQPRNGVKGASYW